MKFYSENHRQRYHNLLNRMRSKDAYHKSAAYLMALANLVPTDVFDFEEDGIVHEGIYKAWQTSSSRMATRLMFNLWNGTYKDLAADKPEDTCSYYTVEGIFYNYEYAPYFLEAIKIRFEWVPTEE